MSDQSENFLTLTRLGIGHPANNILQSIDWLALKDTADQQGLSAIVLDGLERIQQEFSPPIDLKLQWIGEVLQDYESRYVDYEKTIGEMAGFYNRHGFKMMVLKGYACCLDWPKPEHRPCGDIDIWQFGEQEEADTLLAKEKGIEIDNSHRHHTVFDWNGYMVENHYDMLTVDANKTNMILEPILKECAMDDSNYVEIGGEKVFLPPPNFNALYLLRHMLMHFVGSNMNLRQIIDWGFFWEKHGKEVDKKWLCGLLENHHMTPFFNIINAICIENLGFQSSVFPSVQCDTSMKEHVLKEILLPEFDWTKAHDKNVFKRVLFKYKRWKGGAWKRELCCGEGPIESFIWSVRSHLLKPASI